MNSSIPSNKIQTTGVVLSWLVGSAFVGTLVFFVGLIRGNATPGAQAHGPLAHFLNSIAPFLGFMILASEAAALVLLLVGIVRWPSRIIRSPRWVLSALGTLFVAAAIVAFAYIVVVTAISAP